MTLDNCLTLTPLASLGCPLRNSGEGPLWRYSAALERLFSQPSMRRIASRMFSVELA